MKNYVAFLLDEHYVQCTKNTIHSFLNHNTVEPGTITLISTLSVDELEEQFKVLATWHNTTFTYLHYDLAQHNNLQGQSHVTVSTWLRVFLVDMLPDADRILAMDSDIVVVKPMLEIFDIDMRGNILAAVPEFAAEWADNIGVDCYYNTGVLMIDANMWRKENVTKQILDYVENPTHPITLADQDTLNRVCHGRFYAIADKYNYLMEGYLYLPLPAWWRFPYIKVFHFNGPVKPWHLNSPREHIPIYALSEFNL